MTLYPIVTVGEGFGGKTKVEWFANEYSRNSGYTGIGADDEGVYVYFAPMLKDLADVAEFQRTVQEAWDAVRAIRHGTSLERFPRDLTAVSDQTSADL